MITVYKASAGSGKTYALAQQYIRLLLKSEEPHQYRHILAVTFTNKATDEMKRRILKELHILATAPEKSGYSKDFIPSLFPDERTMSDKAGKVLCAILHDYGAFAVSTIDRFFQQTLRAFSREIGHFASYQVELDRKGLLDESVDRILDSLSESPEHEHLLNWIADNTISSMEDGRKFHIEYGLKDLAARLESTERHAKCEEYGISDEELFSKESLDSLSETCSRILKDFPELLDKVVSDLGRTFADAGINPDDTYRSFLSIALENYPQKGLDAFTDAVKKRLKDETTWFKSSDKVNPNRVTEAIREAVGVLLRVLEEDAKVANTAKILKEQIFGFGVAAELSRSFRELLHEKNVLSLDDSNSILRDIIDGTDAPFIYEKMGVRFENFLLDEFQDTSRIQWNNFLPLLKNSTASGYESLIVGDVKQSIYRWRDSDWKLLGYEVAEEFRGDMEMVDLDTNWRSHKEIIDFNNDFFTFARKHLDMMCGPDSEIISSLYSGVKQKVSSAKSEGGFVSVELCAQDEQEGKVIEIINQVKEKGFRMGDIAVLVRGKKEGAVLSNALIAAGIRVLTDDSLLIRSSVTVRRLEAILAGIDNPKDDFSQFLNRELDVETPEQWHSLTELCDFILEALRQKDEETFEAETLYIQSYMDKVRDFMVNEGNELHAFLKHMKDDGSTINSPDTDEYVRLITIHKSKGLDFPVVIVPFLEKISLYRDEMKWCRPRVKGTALESAAWGVYDVKLSGKSTGNLFKDEYEKEKLMQYVDNLNLAYVAFTRASEAMFILGSTDGRIKGFAGVMEEFLGKGRNSMTVGELIHHDNGKDESDQEIIDAHYRSYELGDRLGISRDASDFFDSEDNPGSSARIRGIVLHDILSSVVVPSRLQSAVSSAVASGSLPSDQAGEVSELLGRRIASAAARGWFPDDPSCVLDEADVIDSDGLVYRPDRVVLRPDGGVTIIDYKFGSHRKKYEDQVRNYMSLYKSMGYSKVDGALWYVWEDVEKSISL